MSANQQPTSKLLKALWLSLGLFCVIAILGCGCECGPAPDEFGRYPYGGGLPFAPHMLYVCFAGILIPSLVYWLNYLCFGGGIPRRLVWSTLLTLVFFVLLLVVEFSLIAEMVRASEIEAAFIVLAGMLLAGAFQMIFAIRIVIDEWHGINANFAKAFSSVVGLLLLIPMFLYAANPRDNDLGTSQYPVVTRAELESMPWYIMRMRVDFRDEALFDELENFPFLTEFEAGPSTYQRYICPEHEGR